MHVVVVQPDFSGHHVVLYLRHLARELQRRGWEATILTTPGARDSSEVALLMSEVGAWLRFAYIEDPPRPESPTRLSLLEYQMARYRAIARGFKALCRAQPVDAVFAEYLDPLERTIVAFGSPFGDTPFVGLHMDARFHHRSMGLGDSGRTGLLEKQILQLLLRRRSLRVLLTIDESLADFARARPWRGAEKIRFLADPVTSHVPLPRGDARHLLGIPPDAFCILLYGAIAERKGIRLLIETLLRSDGPSHAVALVAGRQDDFTRALLSGPDAVALGRAGRLFEVRGFVDDPTERAVFSAADAAWLVYRGFPAMSGFLVQAGAMRLPVIASAEGVIGWITRRHGLGELVSAGNEVQAASAIRRLADDVDLRRQYADNAARHSMRHTPENFAGTICDALAEAVQRRGD